MAYIANGTGLAQRGISNAGECNTTISLGANRHGWKEKNVQQVLPLRQKGRNITYDENKNDEHHQLDELSIIILKR